MGHSSGRSREGMTPSRRGVLAGVVSGSTLGALAVSGLAEFRAPEIDHLSDRDLEVLLAIADAIHPTEPTRFRSPLVRYLEEKSDQRRGELQYTRIEFDQLAVRRTGAGFVSMNARQARLFLHTIGVSRVQSQRKGTLVERIRFHLLNTVLYVTMTDPAGTAIFDISNPIGYPGGMAPDS